MHILVDFTTKSTSVLSDFCVGFVHMLLHVVQQRTSPLCFFFFLFTKLFQRLLDDVSFFVLLSSSIAASSTNLCNFDSLSALSLQLMVQVFDFSFKADPSASISAEISFHFPWCFELFHSS